MHILSTTAMIKIRKQRVKTTEKIKYNHKKYSLIQKKAKKKEGEKQETHITR